jgi:hypothetical protein
LIAEALETLYPELMEGQPEAIIAVPQKIPWRESPQNRPAPVLRRLRGRGLAAAIS